MIFNFFSNSKQMGKKLSDFMPLSKTLKMMEKKFKANFCHFSEMLLNLNFGLSSLRSSNF
jgi:hypothetical protein